MRLSAHCRLFILYEISLLVAFWLVIGWSAIPPNARPTRVTGFGSHRAFHPPTTARNETFKLRIIESGGSLVVQSKDRTVQISSQEDGGIAVQFVDISTSQGSQNSTSTEAEGLYGVYFTPSGTLWVWIASSELVYSAPRPRGTLDWWSIRKVQRLHIANVKNHRSLTRTQRQEEKRQIELLRYALKDHDWYFSCGTIPDLTRNLQSNILRQQDPNSTVSPWWSPNCTQRPDSQFFWNEQVVDPVLKDQQNNASRFLLEHVVPITSAFCGIQTNLTTGNQTSKIRYDELLITRRSRLRAGTRFTKRGADHTGAAANYAETEQILLIHNKKQRLKSVCSHVQIRGSIPLRWSSPTDIKTYRPRVRIGIDPIAQALALRKHLVDVASHYVLQPTAPAFKLHPSLVLVNLVDKKSDQGRLGRTFDAVLKAVLEICERYDKEPRTVLNSTTVEHLWFDFHAEVRNGQWQRLRVLLDQLKESILEQSYFRTTPVANSNPVRFLPERLQTGIVRTNCMDCLDRTNVVQSLVGRYVLMTQLADLKIVKLPLAYKALFHKNPMSLPWTDGELSHRLLWADNADAVSRLYAGTPALKGDFTRTGRRTKRGALDDGMNSIQRYYLNNFMDADRQEGIDLLVGFQPFGSPVEEDEVGSKNSPPLSPFRFQGKDLKQAARHALLHSYDSDLFGESEHQRLKLLPVGGAIGQRRKGLDLRWLPGDLQTQMRGLAVSSSTDLSETRTDMDALLALDYRSRRDFPWWCTIDTSDSEARISTTLADAETSASNNAGYLLGAVLTGTQSPMVMAAIVLGLISVWLTE